jgi:hypothetical protein
MSLAPAQQDRARYGVMALFVITLIVWLVAGPIRDVTLYLFVINILGGAVLLSCTWSARLGRRALIIASIGCALCVVSAISVIFVSEPVARLSTAIVLLVVSLCAPIVTARGVLARRRVDVQLVLAAISIYLLLGLIAAMSLVIAGEIQSDPLLVHASSNTDGSFRDKVYFSFVTLLTVGYGDYAPASGTARAIAIITAAGGQLYLITAVATAVSQLAALRFQSRDEELGV